MEFDCDAGPAKARGIVDIFVDKEIELLLGHEHPNLFQNIANIFRNRGT